MAKMGTGAIFRSSEYNANLEGVLGKIAPVPILFDEEHA